MEAYYSHGANLRLAKPLFANFLIADLRADGSVMYIRRIAVFKQQYRRGMFPFSDHVEPVIPDAVRRSQRCS